MLGCSVNSLGLRHCYEHPSVTPYVPFDASKYVRQSDLSKIELSILSNRSHRSDWGYLNQRYLSS